MKDEVPIIERRAGSIKSCGADINYRRCRRQFPIARAIEVPIFGTSSGFCPWAHPIPPSPFRRPRSPSVRLTLPSSIHQRARHALNPEISAHLPSSPPLRRPFSRVPVLLIRPIVLSISLADSPKTPTYIDPNFRRD